MSLSTKRHENITERSQNIDGQIKLLQQYIFRHVFTLFSLHFPLPDHLIFSFQTEDEHDWKLKAQL